MCGDFVRLRTNSSSSVIIISNNPFGFAFLEQAVGYGVLQHQEERYGANRTSSSSSISSSSDEEDDPSNHYNDNGGGSSLLEKQYNVLQFLRQCHWRQSGATAAAIYAGTGVDLSEEMTVATMLQQNSKVRVVVAEMTGESTAVGPAESSLDGPAASHDDRHYFYRPNIRKCTTR